jgi:hypothetical protein
MGKSSPPPPPDAKETARAETQFNRFDTYSPSGSGVRHGYTDASGQFVGGVVPDNAQAAQKYIESQTDAAIRGLAEPAAVQLTQRVIDDNVTNMPDAARIKDRGNVAQSIFDRTMSMMRPEIDKNQSRLLSNLQNRGLPVGSEAFNDSYTAQQRETDNMISRLAMDADIAAGQEQSRMFGLESQERSNSISELMAAITGNYTPVNNLPSGQGQPVAYGSMVQNQYDAQMQQWQIKNQQASQTAGALGSLGAALIKSDMAMKEIHGIVDMAFAQRVLVAMPVQAWRYKDGVGDDAVHVGPMAQDFQRITGLGDGENINVIDYLGLLHAALQGAFWRISVLEHQINGGEVH